MDQTVLLRKAGQSVRGRAARSPEPGTSFSRDRVTIHFDRAENLYGEWPTPVCIIVDGPYGVGGFPGDPPNPEPLADWYRSHVEAWSRQATPQTTLWFWGTEVGWATVHPVLVAAGWQYRCCHIWNKGLSHVAGNANSLTLRKFPVVTEVCVQYVKAAKFRVGDRELSMQDWLRYEWKRTGLPWKLANQATGTLNAATRKYLTADHLWYYPPVEAFEGLVAYANEHGKPAGRPYFSVDGKRPFAPSSTARLASTTSGPNRRFEGPNDSRRSPTAYTIARSPCA